MLVALWGFPSHFGYDPTCLLFRGTFDVSCWTAGFQPKARIFSTMGQPDWLATYLAALLPISLALFLEDFPGKISKNLSLNNPIFLKLGLLLLMALMYVDILFTGSRSVIVVSWASVAVFLAWFAYIYIKPKFIKEKFNLDFKLFGGVILIFLLITFFNSLPFALNRFTFGGIMAQLAARHAATTQVKTPPSAAPTSPVSTGELGGTDSGTIRLLVWRGAIDIWKNNPIFGTGVETFAFAYYKYRPAAHNLTSEWKYLYNKAHNEYLNYLATTGAVGLLTYLSIIAAFLFVSMKYLWKNKAKQTLLPAALVTGFLAIIVANFFGFSVVMINILFFIIPGIFLVLLNLNPDKHYIFPAKSKGINYAGKRQIAAMAVLGLIGVFAIYSLINFWNADKAYYLGFNYDRTGDYQKAYLFLKQAVSLRPSEPTFQDEFSINNGVLAIMFLQQNQQIKDKNTQDQNLAIAKQLVDQAITSSNQLIASYPNNVTFWKTRVRLFYSLAQVDPQYLQFALEAIKKAAALAPTDADISYNLGVLEGQSGDIKGAISTLQNTIKLKIDYEQAYYAIGIFYRQLAVNAKGTVINQGYNQKAIAEMKLIIKDFGPNKDAQNAINTWTGSHQ
jgi:O-antigen ligase